MMKKRESNQGCAKTISTTCNQVMQRVPWTNKHVRAFRLGMKYGLLSTLVACGTKPMLWLSRRVIWLQAICKNPRHYCIKRIAGAVLLPPLICYELLFEIFIRIQELLIVGLYSSNLALEVKDSSIQFNLERTKFSFIACLNNCLCYIGHVSNRHDEGI